MADDTPTVEQVIRVYCPHCQHEWIAAYLPMLISVLSKVLRQNRCPRCGKRGALLGRAPRPATS